MISINIDVLETIINATKHDKRHSALLSQLESKLELIGIKHAKTIDGMRSANKLYDADHKLIHGNHEQWLEEKIKDFESSGISKTAAANKVWETYKNSGYLLGKTLIDLEYFTIHCGNEPDEFFQFEVEVRQESIFYEQFTNKPYGYIADLYDLTNSAAGKKLDEPINLGNQYYHFKKLLNARTLVREMDDVYSNMFDMRQNMTLSMRNTQTGVEVVEKYKEIYPNEKKLPANIQRIMNDWAESSAGQAGEIFCDHWVLSNSEWRDSSGVRQLSAIPYWTTKKNIKEIKSVKNMSAYALFDKVLNIDKKAGYTFAWYFFMLHGNRVKDWVGISILRAAEDGLIVIPECDYRVLKRWANYRYGF